MLRKRCLLNIFVCLRRTHYHHHHQLSSQAKKENEQGKERPNLNKPHVPYLLWHQLFEEKKTFSAPFYDKNHKINLILRCDKKKNKTNGKPTNQVIHTLEVQHNNANHKSSSICKPERM